MEKCCICGCDIENWGNNPRGAAWKNAKGKVVFPEFTENDRCCDMCNGLYVIPGRLYKMKRREKEHEKSKK